MTVHRQPLAIGQFVTIFNGADVKQGVGILLRRFQQRCWVLTTTDSGALIEKEFLRGDLRSRQNKHIKASDEKNPQLRWLYENAITQLPPPASSRETKNQSVFCQKCLVPVVPNDKGKCDFCGSDLRYPAKDDRSKPAEERFSGSVNAFLKSEPTKLGRPVISSRQFYHCQIHCQQCHKTWFAIIKRRSKEDAEEYVQARLDLNLHPYSSHDLTSTVFVDNMATQENEEWFEEE